MMIEWMHQGGGREMDKPKLGRPFKEGEDPYAFMRPWVKRAKEDNKSLREVCRLAGIEQQRMTVLNWLEGRYSKSSRKVYDPHLPPDLAERLLEWIMEEYPEYRDEALMAWVPSVKDLVDKLEERERIERQKEASNAAWDERLAELPKP
jgi:hypothetical protein